MLDSKNNCVLCANEIVYFDQSAKFKCSYCNKEYASNASCKSGHFVCDACHGAAAGDIITAFCLNTNDTNPLAMAVKLMCHPALKMHGPEHHYLIPAVLITAYFNATKKAGDLAAKLEETKKRSANVLGGFCGFYGSCGAAVGTGIFMSVITGATPLSGKEWQAANLMTASALNMIALHGGPRCCKRNTFFAIQAAQKFALDYLKVGLDFSENNPVCEFFRLNKECRKEECLFYPDI